MNQQEYATQLELGALIERHGLLWEWRPRSRGWSPATSSDQVPSKLYYGFPIHIAPDEWIPHAHSSVCPVRGDMRVDVQNRDGGLSSIRANVVGWLSVHCWRPAQPEAAPPFNLREHVAKSFQALREDHRFHRNDWTEEMLPAGWRPLLVMELAAGCDQQFFNKQWCKALGDSHYNSRHSHCRTQRPLPHLTAEQVADGWVEWSGGKCPVEPESQPKVMFRALGISDGYHACNWVWTHVENPFNIIAYKPDPYGKFRQALADGKKVQFRVKGTETWMRLSADETTFSSDFEYRIVTTQTVQLGPEDAPPGSVVRPPGAYAFAWHTVFSCLSTCIVSATYGAVLFETLKEAGWQINRSIPLTGKWDANAWEPCSKTVDVEEGGAT